MKKDEHIGGTVLGYNTTLYYADSKYKIYSLTALIAVVLALVMADMVPLAAAALPILTIISLPYLLGISGALALSKENIQRVLWRCRLSVEQIYAKIPGSGFLTRGLALTAGDIAGINERDGNWSKAAELRQLSVDEILKRKPPEPANVVVFKTLQLTGFLQAGDTARLEKQIAEILAAASELSHEHPVQIAPCMSSCAVILAELGRFEEAISTAQKAVELMQSQSLDKTPAKLRQQLDSFAACLNDLSYIYRSGGWYEEAIDYLKRAYALRTSGFCANNSANTLVEYANFHATSYKWLNNLTLVNVWTVVASKTAQLYKTAVFPDTSDVALLNLEYQKVASKLSTPPDSQLLKFATSEKWRPFNIKLENLITLGEYYRALGDGEKSQKYFQSAYALIPSASPGADRRRARIEQCEHPQ